jgi:hypothetical protein
MDTSPVASATTEMMDQLLFISTPLSLGLAFAGMALFA